VTEWIAARRRRLAAWTARRCAIGSIASTASGPEGLIDHWTEGLTRSSAEQLAEFAQIVEAGPDGVVRWRRIDLRRVIREVRRRLSFALRRKTAAEAWHKLEYNESTKVDEDFTFYV
jgi:hypothetical protein